MSAHDEWPDEGSTLETLAEAASRLEGRVEQQEGGGWWVQLSGSAGLTVNATGVDAFPLAVVKDDQAERLALGASDDVALYEQAPPEMLKAEIDVFWIQAGGGDPAAWIRKCAGREPILHLKDMAMGPDREQRMAEIGEGNLNWPAILQAAEESGVEWYLVEQDNCYDRDPFESLAISYRNLRAMGLS